MRNLKFVEKEFYHIYNRGVDKRPIFINSSDTERFFAAMEILNNTETVGSLERVINARKHEVFTDLPLKKRLVQFVAYCLNQNHFHFILEQVAENGIEKFMHKLGMAHSKFINTKYKRSGALFQGSFKAKLIDSNEYLLHLSAYVNLNHIAHGRKHSVFTGSRTSWGEYTEESYRDELCEKKVVLEQFKSKKDYKKFAESSLKSIVERKILMEELEDAGIELVHTA